MENILVDNTKIMTKGQITLPKDIRDALGVDTGNRVTLMQTTTTNSAAYHESMTSP